VVSVRGRITVSLIIGAATGTVCWLWLNHSGLGAGDFNWAIWAAQDLLAHRNPYDRPQQLYPLTCAIFGFPFVWMPPALAGALFYGISSALLALGVSRHGYHRLLIFLAYPYWAGLLEAQWVPLILAGAYLPLLLPATLAKPQLGAPIFLSTATRKGALACVALAAISFLLMPGWLPQWLSHIHDYARFIPLLVLPGPLLLLSLLRYRAADARVLLLAALMPQRWFYDGLILWFIPKSRREIVWTCFLSWIPGIWRWYHFPHSFYEVGRWMVIFFYLPMLVVVLLRPPASEGDSGRL
jgi:hypothetical protein